MDWRFCPLCETQLDDATGTCPACAWDPSALPPPAPPAPKQSLVERYRGTEYDSGYTPAGIRARGSAGPTLKVRALFLAGVVALVAVYGGMAAWPMVRDAVSPAAAQVDARFGR